jgi:DNA-binding transcriptional MerR regulator
VSEHEAEPSDAEPTGTVREYRTEELADAAGITVRTLRFYRERKLLPPPRREGRIAWYDDHHLARLRTIAALLERGHTLGGIAELTAAFENGRDVNQLGELLGLDGGGLGWSEETPVRLTPEELADYFEGEVTPENLAASLDLGYLAVDGDEIVHVSRRLLDVSSALVREGVPLALVLETGRRVREHADALAALFTDLIAAQTGTPEGASEASPDPEALVKAVDRLRPLAKSVVEAELSMAMDRRLRPPAAGA